MNTILGTRQTRRRAIAAIALLPVVLAGCDSADHDDRVATQTSGQVPERIPRGHTVTVTTCEVNRAGYASVAAHVLNTGSRPASLQGVPFTVRDADGRVITSDSSELWNSIDIGPGRRALVSGDVDLQTEAEPGSEITCEPGTADLRPDDGFRSGRELTPDEVALRDCAGSVTVRNPTDEEIGVRVLIEFFDAGGNSVGTQQLGQWPTDYSNGHLGDETDEALPGGETGTYPITVTQRMDDYGTPSEGEIVGCEVVAAHYVTDPEPIEVIVD